MKDFHKQRWKGLFAGHGGKSLNHIVLFSIKLGWTESDFRTCETVGDWFNIF